MDPKLDEIYRLTLETNRMVHKMRRGILWARIVTIAWWIVIAALSGYTYYVYAQPYVNRLLQIYAQVQQSTAQAQSLQTEVSSFFGNWTQQHGASAPAAGTTTSAH